MSHKNDVETFLQMVISGKIREAYDQYVDSSFIHHNQYFKGDRESLLLAMEKNHKKNPNKYCEIKLIIEEDDIVATHSHVKQNANELGVAVVHIFKFKNNRIVELWDVGQPISKDSPNENGMF